MASITLENASIEIPIYNARGRSIRISLLRKVGGNVGSDERNVVTVRALEDINLDLRPGDRLAIMGHNGAGKSTMLRVLSGAYEPVIGRATIKGSVSSLLDLTMGLDSELTGAENVVLRGVLFGLSIPEARRLIPEVAEFSQLGEYMDLPLRTYSSGMLLRLAFAISTSRPRDILLLDELISVGDATFAERARKRIEAIMDKASILVLASHDMKTLAQYCNRAILLEGGRIIEEGDVSFVAAKYTERQQG